MITSHTNGHAHDMKTDTQQHIKQRDNFEACNEQQEHRYHMELQKVMSKLEGQTNAETYEELTSRAKHYVIRTIETTRINIGT